jgi:hypothetical protein
MSIAQQDDQPAAAAAAEQGASASLQIQPPSGGFDSATQREIYRYVSQAHTRIYEQVERIVRYEMERMCAQIDQLQLLQKLHALELLKTQQESTVGALQAEIASNAQRHHGELVKLADMAANEIVPLARKFERAQRQSKKFKKELTCVACRVRKRAVAMLPCAHLALCKRCSGDDHAAAACCPVCNAPIERMLPIVIE